MNEVLTRNRSAIWVVIASGLITFAWALASPVGSAPDEPSHVARAYGLISGQQDLFPEVDGLAAPLPEGYLGEGSGAVAPYVDTRVPRYFVESPRAGCYAFRADLSAVECLPRFQSQFVTVKGFQSYFVPGYGFFAGSLLRATELLGVADPWGLTITRALSALFNGAIFGLGVVLALPAQRRRFSALVLLTLFMPLTIFSLSGITPSSWEISGTALLVGAAIALSRKATGWAATPSKLPFAESKGLYLAAGLGGAMAATARPFGLVWVGVVLIGLLTLRRVSYWLLGWLVALIALGAFWFFWSAGFQNEEVSDPFRANQGGLRPREILAYLLVGGVQYFGRVTAVWSDFANTGWLDTPLPAPLALIWVVAISSLIMFTLGLRVVRAVTPPTNARQIWVIGVGLVVAMTILFWVLFAYADFSVQSRHLLPGLLGAILAAGALGLSYNFNFGIDSVGLRRGLAFCVAVLALAQVLSLLWMQWRYAFGLVIRAPVGFTIQSRPVADWLPVGGLWLPPLIASIGGVLALLSLRPAQKTSVPATAGTAKTEAA